MSGVYFDARINGEQLQKDIAAINAKLNGLTGNVQKAGNEMDGVFRKLAGAMAGYFSLNFGAQFVTSIAKVRGEFQQLEVAFETMLDSKDKADKLMAQVVDFASKTPFELKDVGSGAKSLLAFGVAAEDLMPTLKSLGDVAAGLSVPIDRLILNFGQIKTQGQLTGRELRDFAVAGVPLVATLSQTLNKSEKDIQDMVSAGKIGFKEVQDAFTAMSSEGGRFANLMEKQSKTITGMQANLRDAWDQMLNNIGKNNEGLISGSIQAATNLVNSYEKVIDVLKVLIATYGAYKAAVIATTVINSASMMAANIRAWVQLAVGIRSAKDAQIAFNLATKLNPYGLMLAAVAALLSALVLFKKNTSAAVEVSSDFIQSIDKEREAVNRLFSVLKSDTTTREQKTTAIKSINGVYGEYLKNLLDEKASLQEIDKAQKEIIKGMAQKIGLESVSFDLTKVREQINKTQAELKEGTNRIVESMDLTTSQKVDLARKFDTIQDFYSRGLIKTKDGLRKSIIKAFTNLGVDINIQSWRDQIDGVADSMESLISAQNRESAALKENKDITEDYLNKLGIYAKEAGKTEIEQTNKEKLQKLIADYTAAKAQLAELNKPEARVSDELKKQQAEIVKGYEDQLKEYGYIVKQQEKEEKDRLKSAEEIAEKEIDIIRRTQTAKIAVMQEGADRQRAEAKLEYDQQLTDLEKFKSEYIAAVNADSSLTTVQKQAKISFVNDQTTEQKTAASQVYANKLVEIERVAADRIKQIWSEVTSVFQTDQQREITAINEKYQKMIGEAVKAKNIILATDLEAARKQLVNETDTSAEMQRIGFEEEVATRRLELSKKIGLNEIQIEKEKNAILIKFAKQRIDALSKLGTAQAKQEAELLGIYIEELESKTKELGDIDLNEVISAFGKVAGAVGEINEELGKALNSMVAFAQSAVQLGAGIASGNVGAMIAGGAGIIAQIISLIANQENQAEVDLKKYNKQLERTVNLLNSIDKAKSYLNNDDFLKYSKLQMSIIDKSMKTIMRTYAPQLYEAGASPMRMVSQLMIGADYLIAKYGELSVEQQQALNDAIAFADQYYAIQNETYERVFSGTASSITDSIVEGFQNGTDAIQGFADTFESIMRNAIMNIAKNEIMMKFIGPWLDDIVKMSEGGFTKEEIDQSKATGEAAYNSSRVIFGFWDKFLKDIAGFGLLNPEDVIKENSLTGSIKGITEETAGLIAGQFMAMRENLLGVLNYTRTISDKIGLTDTDLTSVRENLLGVLNQSRTISDIMPSMSTYMMSINERLGFVGTDITAMRYTSEQIEQNGILQLAAVNESVTHLAQIEKNTRNNEKLNSIDARLEELNKNIKNL